MSPEVLASWHWSKARLRIWQKRTNQRRVWAVLTNERPAFTWHLCQCWTPGPQTPTAPTFLDHLGVKTCVKSLQSFIIIIKVISEKANCGPVLIGRILPENMALKNIIHNILFKLFQCCVAVLVISKVTFWFIHTNTYMGLANPTHTLEVGHKMQN